MYLKPAKHLHVIAKRLINLWPSENKTMKNASISIQID